jgi:hypothetical protein
LTLTKKDWMKKELDKIVKVKKESFLPEDAMVTNEHLK